jgi:hypothetical protein
VCWSSHTTAGFLDRIATHIMPSRATPQVVFFDGNYQGVRGGQTQTPRRRGRPTQAHPVQAAEGFEPLVSPRFGKPAGAQVALALTASWP